MHQVRLPFLLNKGALRSRRAGFVYGIFQVVHVGAGWLAYDSWRFFERDRMNETPMCYGLCVCRHGCRCRIVNGRFDAYDAAIRIHKEQEVFTGATTGIGEGISALLLEIRGLVLRPFDRAFVEGRS